MQAELKKMNDAKLGGMQQASLVLGEWGMARSTA